MKNRYFKSVILIVILIIILVAGVGVYRHFNEKGNAVVPNLFQGLDWKSSSATDEFGGLQNDERGYFYTFPFEGTKWSATIKFSLGHTIDSQVKAVTEYYESQLNSNAWTDNGIALKNYSIEGPSAGRGKGCVYDRSYLKIQNGKVYDVTIYGGPNFAPISPTDIEDGPCQGTILSYSISVFVSDPVDISKLDTQSAVSK